MKQFTLFITGGAGFIGSNLVKYFLNHERIKLVRVIDNLSNGYIKNIEDFIENKKFEFIEGDIRDFEICNKVTKGIDLISHQAALGSVPRSIEDPINTASVNIIGTINILNASIKNNIQRVVLAFSSSSYGDNLSLPKIEENIGNPLSPYAVSKYSIEQFSDVFNKIYGLNYIGFRYFNVFGQNQYSDNPYAAVLPIFVNGFLNNKKIKINGDGKTTRDFTYVSNVVHANELALFTKRKESLNQTYNIACNKSISLNDIIIELNKIFKKNITIEYGDERKGDVKYSLASISKAEKLLGYKPRVYFKEGLRKYINWKKNNL